MRELIDGDVVKLYLAGGVDSRNMVDNIETRCPDCGEQVEVSTHDQATGYDCPRCGYSIY